MIMERFPKVKFIVFTIVIITLVNVAALAVILRYSYKEHCNDVEEKKTSSHKGFDYIKDYLDLTPQQVELFKNEKDSFFSNANLLFDQLEEKRKEMIQNLSVDKPDTVSLYRISDEMGAIHGKLKRNVVNHVLKLRSYCSQEQVVKLDSLYNKIIRTDSPWRDKHKQEEGRDKHK
jgi:hypothetical protein